MFVNIVRHTSIPAKVAIGPETSRHPSYPYVIVIGIRRPVVRQDQRDSNRNILALQHPQNEHAYSINLRFCFDWNMLKTVRATHLKWVTSSSYGHITEIPEMSLSHWSLNGKKLVAVIKNLISLSTFAFYLLICRQMKIGAWSASSLRCWPVKTQKRLFSRGEFIRRLKLFETPQYLISQWYAAWSKVFSIFWIYAWDALVRPSSAKKPPGEE